MTNKSSICKIHFCVIDGELNFDGSFQLGGGGEVSHLTLALYNDPNCRIPRDL